MSGRERARGARRRAIGGWALAALGLGAVAAVIAYALLGAEALPKGPVPVAWDRQPCAHCQMHVGDPGFAVQLQLDDGDVLYFDDPACYFAYLDEHHVEVHATYFHHRRDDRWLTPPNVAFVWEATSPMGGGLAAVDAGTAGALDYETARARARAGGWTRSARDTEATASPSAGG